MVFYSQNRAGLEETKGQGDREIYTKVVYPFLAFVGNKSRRNHASFLLFTAMALCGHKCCVYQDALHR
jgi:hypothetical protein